MKLNILEKPIEKSNVLVELVNGDIKTKVK